MQSTKQNIYLNRCLTVTLAREVMSIVTIITIIVLKKDSGDIATFICCSVKVLILSANGYVLIKDMKMKRDGLECGYYVVCWMQAFQCKC